MSDCSNSGLAAIGTTRKHGDFDDVAFVAKEAWVCLDAIAGMDDSLFDVHGYARYCADEIARRLACVGVMVDG